MKMEFASIYMNKTTIMGEVYRSGRFRTPAGAELKMGIWCDRIGESRARQTDGREPRRLRLLGLHAAVGIVSGCGFYESPLSGRLRVKTGDAIFVRPEEPCAYWPDGEWTERFVVWGGPEANTASSLLMPPANSGGNLLEGAADDVLEAHEKLSSMMEFEDIGAAFARRIEIEKLLLALSRRVAGANPHRAPESIRKAMELLVKGRLDASETGIAGIARECGLSQTHFRRLFKKCAGRSPKDYAMSIRLSKAKGMLAAGCGLKETAMACGFSDVFHFMRSFKKATGMTAGSYAKSPFQGSAIPNGRNEDGSCGQKPPSGSADGRWRQAARRRCRPHSGNDASGSRPA